MAKKLVDLAEYLLILILHNLDISNILAARQTCRKLYDASSAKLLWVYVFRDLAAQKLSVLPPSIQSLDSLDNTETEAFVRRSAKLGQLLHNSNYLSTRRSIPLNIAQPVQWLRLVSGRWLLVASSDHSVSKLSCWDISLVTRGLLEPVAECFLPGVSKTGRVEVQDGLGIIIALAVGPSRSSNVQILSLCLLDGEPRFTELAKLVGFSHVSLLRGQYVACGLRDDVSTPHLVNWHTQKIHPLAKGPDYIGGLIDIDVLDDFVFVTRLSDIEIFSLPEGDSAPRLLQTIVFPEGMQEVAFIPDPCAAEGRTPFSANLIAMTEFGISFFRLSRDPVDNLFSLHRTHKRDLNQPQDFPWSNLRVGSTGRCIMWLNYTEDDAVPLPKLTYGVLESKLIEGIEGDGDNTIATKDIVLARKVSCDIKNTNTVALWGYAHFDMDDSLGFIVAGNVFGELCVYDIAGTPSARLWPKSSVVLQEPSRPYRKLASLKPLSLGLPPLLPRPPHYFFDEQFGHIPAFDYWVLPDLADLGKLPDGWSTDWKSFRDSSQWQGFPGDRSWFLEHYYGFLGDARPLAFHREAVVFKAGGLYFFMWIFTEADDALLLFEPHTTLADVRENIEKMSQHDYMSNYRRVERWRYSGLHQSNVYSRLWSYENCCPGRNRWGELKARGGFPHPTLQVVLPP